MKRLIFILSLTLLAVAGYSQEHRFRVYPFNDKTVLLKDVDSTATTAIETIYFDRDSTLFFDAAGSLSVLKFNASGYEIGVVPGVGYGLNWQPAWSTADDQLLSLSGFLNAGLTTDGDTYLKFSPSVLLGVWDNRLLLGVSYDIGVNVSGGDNNKGFYFMFGTKLFTF